jgi:hypothetical protein
VLVELTRAAEARIQARAAAENASIRWEQQIRAAAKAGLPHTQVAQAAGTTVAHVRVVLTSGPDGRAATHRQLREPVFGSCAGMILLGRRGRDGPDLGSRRSDRRRAAAHPHGGEVGSRLVPVGGGSTPDLGRFTLGGSRDAAGPITHGEIGHFQLQPDVEPHPSQTKHDPAGRILVPQVKHIGASEARP